MASVIEQVQAAGLADELRGNAEQYIKAAIRWEDFDATAKRLWDEAENLGLVEDVLMILRNDAE